MSKEAMKYELVKTDTKQFAGRTLYRIRAIIAIGSSVAAGDFGGYIESEKNLSKESGNAWVSNHAMVSGNALVSGDAMVSGDALVFGNAVVSGNARVFGDARVSGDVRVFGNAWVSGNAMVTGDAWVSGDAWVFGDALVFGNARVFGDARVSGDARVKKSSDYLQIGPTKSSNQFTTAFVDLKIGIRVVCGCFNGSLLEFSQQIESIHKDNKEALEQYRLFCQLIAFNFGVQA